MTTVNMLDAKTNLSKLVEAIESGVETEIIIARNGKPAARLTALSPKKREIKFGLAKGKFVAPDDFDADNDLMPRCFTARTSEVSPRLAYRGLGRYRRFQAFAACGELRDLHGDPFDRLLIAQAMSEPLILLTHDRAVAAYGDTIVLV